MRMIERLQLCWQLRRHYYFSWRGAWTRSGNLMRGQWL